MATVAFNNGLLPILFHFPGIAAVDDADGQYVITIPGNGTFHVIQIEITNTSGVLGTGTTTVYASLSSLGDGISASITHEERRSAAATTAYPGLEFSAGSSIYIYRSAAGGHVDVQGVAHVRMA